jgi:predicted dehydrogenase
MMSIQQKIGVGIIGLRMGRSHLESYVSNPRTEVKGICDLDDDLLGEISKSYNIPAADKDYRKILERGDIDLISVATPDLFHRDHCIKSLEAGKDVLCEKPLAVSREDCREIIDAVKRPYTMRSLFYGSEGTIIADNTSPYIQLYTTKSLMKLEFAKIPVDISSHNVSAEIEYFLEALLDGKALELDAIEGANTVAATLAITESAKNHGKSVGVDLFNR